MQTAAPLQPTLWRTCRVLANPIRMEILALLLRQPGQTVSAVAHDLHQSVALTSLYLRALEARGLLIARRDGRWVSYRLGPATGSSATADLVAALRATFQREADPVRTIFRLATAFTHPRRIEIFRLLQTGPRTLSQLRAASRISGWALLRHLKKLEERGLVRQHDGFYSVANRPDDLGRELARLASQ